jgi:hypothetical protein
MPVVPAVHEHVHQRADQQDQPGQGAEQMRTVLGQQEPCGHRRQYQAPEAES